MNIACSMQSLAILSRKIPSTIEQKSQTYLVLHYLEKKSDVQIFDI